MASQVAPVYKGEGSATNLKLDICCGCFNWVIHFGVNWDAQLMLTGTLSWNTRKKFNDWNFQLKCCSPISQWLKCWQKVGPKFAIILLCVVKSLVYVPTPVESIHDPLMYIYNLCDAGVAQASGPINCYSQLLLVLYNSSCLLWSLELHMLLNQLTLFGTPTYTSELKRRHWSTTLGGEKTNALCT